MHLTFRVALALIGSLFFSGAFCTPYRAAPIYPYVRRQLSTYMVEDVYIFPNGTWVESLAVRPNGLILASLLNVPEIVQVNPLNPIEAVTVATIPNVNSVSAIAEISADVYAIAAGNFTIPTAFSQAGSYSLWELNMTTAALRKIADVPDALWLNGITPFNDTHFFVSDSSLGLVYRVESATGIYSIAIQDELMAPPAGVYPPIGINGIRVRSGMLYFTNSMKGLFASLPIKVDGSADGNATVLVSGFSTDDFVFDSAGDALIATDPGNTVVRVSPNCTVTTVAGAANSTVLEGVTDVEFGRTYSDKNVLYVSTNGGLNGRPVNGIITPGKIAKLITDLSG